MKNKKVERSRSEWGEVVAITLYVSVATVAGFGALLFGVTYYPFHVFTKILLALFFSSLLGFWFGLLFAEGKI